MQSPVLSPAGAIVLTLVLPRRLYTSQHSVLFGSPDAAVACTAKADEATNPDKSIIVIGLFMVPPFEADETNQSAFSDPVIFNRRSSRALEP